MLEFYGALKGTTPAEMRDDAVHRIFKRSAQKTFDQYPDAKSALLSVAQYWNDEADDAVHDDVVYSRRHTPLFPHECESREGSGPEFCWYCRRLPDNYLPWDDNGTAISAFEMFCREDCSQDMDVGEAYLPYAVLRRDMSVEIVGRPVRPWFDLELPGGEPVVDETHRKLLQAVFQDPDNPAPRSVLSDFLIERNDPQGTFMAHQLSKRRDQDPRAAQLIAEHSAQWLGPIAHVVPRSGRVFGGGLISEVEAYHRGPNWPRPCLDAIQWGSVRRLHFLDSEGARLSPAMASLAEVSNLSESAVAEAAAFEHLWTIQDLALGAGRIPAALRTSTAFPALQRLELPGDAANDIFDLLSQPIGASVTCWALANPAPATVKATLSGLRKEGQRDLQVVHRFDAGRRGGWSIRFHPTNDRWRMSVTVETLWGGASLEGLISLTEAVADQLDEIRLVPSRYFDPADSDVEALRGAVPSVRVGIET